MERVRRSNRNRKNSSSYDPLSSANDRLLRIALKRSELVSCAKMQIELQQEFKAAAANADSTGIERPPLELLRDIPTIQPSIEEFRDPVSLWQSLNPLGLKFGAIKLKPPEGWKPPFCLDFAKLQFPVRTQKLHELSSGGAFKFPKRLWTGQEFKQFGDAFKEERATRHASDQESTEADSSQEIINGSEDVPHEKSVDNTEKTIRAWEREYWRLVETQAVKLEVMYGADIEVSQTGSGFPDLKRLDKCLHIDREAALKYANDNWNLLNLPNAAGSLLRNFHQVIPGVTCPWLYLGMLFSSFCWHTEDNYFAAANYHHLGDEKIWYIVPPDEAPEMLKLMKSYVGHLSTAQVLHSLAVQISPNLIVKNGINVYRAVQSENEFILLWPRSFHCGFNTGFNCNEACNVAPPIWLDWGHLAISSYRFLRAACIPYEQVIFMAAANFADINRAEEGTKLFKALAMHISDDFQKRQIIPFKQFPVIPFKHSDKLVELFLKSSEESKETENAKTFLKATLRYFEDVASLALPVQGSPDEAFAKQIDSLSRLPCLDCLSCKGACYQGFVACPHSSSALCFYCASTQPKSPCSSRCGKAIALYRFPLKVQYRLLQLLKSKCMKLGENVEALPQNFPTLRAMEAIERAKSQSFKLGMTGPFIWKKGLQASSELTCESKHDVYLPTSVDEASDWLWMNDDSDVDSVPTQDSIVRLSTRHLVMAAQQEVQSDSDDSSSEESSKSHPIHKTNDQIGPRKNMSNQANEAVKRVSIRNGNQIQNQKKSKKDSSNMSLKYESPRSDPGECDLSNENDTVTLKEEIYNVEQGRRPMRSRQPRDPPINGSTRRQRRTESDELTHSTSGDIDKRQRCINEGSLDRNIGTKKHRSDRDYVTSSRSEQDDLNSTKIKRHVLSSISVLFKPDISKKNSVSLKGHRSSSTVSNSNLMDIGIGEVNHDSFVSVDENRLRDSNEVEDINGLLDLKKMLKKGYEESSKPSKDKSTFPENIIELLILNGPLLLKSANELLSNDKLQLDEANRLLKKLDLSSDPARLQAKVLVTAKYASVKQNIEGLEISINLLKHIMEIRRCLGDNVTDIVPLLSSSSVFNRLVAPVTQFLISRLHAALPSYPDSYAMNQTVVKQEDPAVESPQLQMPLTLSQIIQELEMPNNLDTEAVQRFVNAHLIKMLSESQVRPAGNNNANVPLSELNYNHLKLFDRTLLPE